MMQLRKKTRNRNLRRASVLVQGVIFGSAVGVGVAALAVDTGLMFTSKQELQSAADSAALAAASQLGTTGDPTSAAGQEAALFAGLNDIAGLSASVDLQTDIVFGHAVMNGQRFDFQPNQQPYDAVRVTIRRDATAADGPVSLLFAKTFGIDGANLVASATAMLVPRDISLVIDLSGSMNDDSELRHYKDFPSESGGTRDGIQINLKDIWTALPIARGNAGVGNGIDPPPPGNPNSQNDQPGTGPGSPQNAGGNPDPGADPGEGVPRGPRWGWMTGWGEPIVLDQYSPVGDSGLYYIRRYTTCTDSDVIQNLIESGYSPAERSALLSGHYDGVSTRYRNRVKVLLGLAGWRSKKSNGKYNGGPGNGNNVVDSNELFHQVSYEFNGGSWNNWINYVKSSSSRMKQTDPNLRYRYGLKTFVNYLLEKQARHSRAPELADAPEEPLYSVKNAVQAMVDVIVSLDTDDYVSLETFAQYGNHRQDLTNVLQDVPVTLNGHQAGHDTSVTNIGAGLQKGIEELTSVRARTSAAKVIIMLTDGKPNVNQYNSYVGNNHPAAVGWAQESADQAKALGMTVYSIGVGADVNADLCINIASKPEYYFFADNTPDPNNGGQPMYVTQLQQIFQTLGGRRPVRLIQ